MLQYFGLLCIVTKYLIIANSENCNSLQALQVLTGMPSALNHQRTQ